MLPARGIDQAQLSAAILEEVNFQRCLKGRRPLVLAPSQLTRVAEGHSAWMADRGTMSHLGGRETGRTLRDRIRRSGLRVRAWAENLAFLPRGRHSYASLARRVVTLWMQSPGHRRNLLSARQRRMSAAARVSAHEPNGRVWITQLFTS